MSERLQVDESVRLLAFLRRQLSGWKRKTLEQRLREGCVEVNGATIRLPHYELCAGDQVLVRPEGQGVPARIDPAGLTILYADDQLVAIDKPAGLLSVPLESRRGRSALALLRESCSRPGHPARVWPVHRLDREASGVLLFALTSEARAALQGSWGESRKHYLAVVEGRPDPPQGQIDQPLWEDKALNVHVGQQAGAKPARTLYSTLRTTDDRSLLEIELDSGRRHQIRAHLAWLGHPIVGDPRYGTAGLRMGLHALRLVVTHPVRAEPITFEAPPPEAFQALTR